MKHFKGFTKFKPANPLPEGFPVENINNPHIEILSRQYYRYLASQEVQDDEGRVVLFECDENGHCWYDLRDEFSEDTVKVLYEPGTNRVMSFSLDAHRLFPHGNNVIEVAADKVPADLDVHHWKINPETGEFINCEKLKYRTNLARQTALLRDATAHYVALQIMDDKTSAENKLFVALKAYIKAVRRTDLSVEQPSWPTPVM